MAENTTVEHGVTPGPWRFDGDWYRVPSIIGRDGKIVAYMVKAGFPNRQDHTAEENANAHLIAAAPDLLAALIAVRRRGLPDRYTSDAELIAQVDAALLKASPRAGEG